MAPYWADLSYEGSQSGTFYRLTDDTDLLSETVSDMVNINPEFAGFVPKEALIVTWHNPLIRVDFNDIQNFVSSY